MRLKALILAMLSLSCWGWRGEKIRIGAGLIVPHSTFRMRDYMKAKQTAVRELAKEGASFLTSFRLSAEDIHLTMLPLHPSPTLILSTLCQDFLPRNVSVIFYLTNTEVYGRNTASAQYFLQLSSYLGIPVIAWNADNSGLERRVVRSNLLLQLAPTMEHQTRAMLDVLHRYNWDRFSVITTHIAGHADFIQAIRERVLITYPKMKILGEIRVGEDVEKDLIMVPVETRILLLYCTRREAGRILEAASGLGLTGRSYLWIVTQSVVGNTLGAITGLVPGMIAIHFDTTDASLGRAIVQSLQVFAKGLDLLAGSTDPSWVVPHLSCEAQDHISWPYGTHFYRHLRNASLAQMEGMPNLEFDAEGKMKATELRIMNLRPDLTGSLTWEEVASIFIPTVSLWVFSTRSFGGVKIRQIGVWRSWKGEDALDIKDIVWPGNSHVPPEGVPEKFHLRITFMEEPPYLNMGEPDPKTEKCSANRGVLCRAPAHLSPSSRNDTTIHYCCSGFCIDLLEKFAADLGFTYDLFRVKDGVWGAPVAGKWNGLVAALVNDEADVVITSLKINSERAKAIDFSVPFLDTGIAIVVAKRTGIISPTAFLEPFDTLSWTLVALIAIQVVAVAIFIFEWLSPAGYDRKTSPPVGQQFSLLRVYWLVWAVLFQAAVNVDCPRGLTSRSIQFHFPRLFRRPFLASVWAMFAVVFLAIYTANLAAFMITREEFPDLTGIEDPRLRNPRSTNPPFRFGTIPHGNTDTVMKQNFPRMHAYMSQFSRPSVHEGVRSVKQQELDAFIYDATVLEYLVGQDDGCKLLTVGTWYAMTGYGVGFPKNSKYLHLFNHKLMEYRENGDLERMREFWFTGACKPKKTGTSASKPLTINQFLSAFLLLAMGMVLAMLFLACEHLYFKYIRGPLSKSSIRPCCNLLSTSVGQSLRMEDVVEEVMTVEKSGRECQSGWCKQRLLSTEKELALTKARVKQLEDEMRFRGIRPDSPPPLGRRRRRNTRSGSEWETDTENEDSVQNHVSSFLWSRDPRPRKGTKEVAEYETVL
ncbi:unnamed protein product [Darwinula stevensoni]|uniref:Glutamate receptor ionotropic, NMDA 2B n=1 Tax=Darwinula stevensoni TaxID=69355 RepID=A0A7R8X970_9CRUS|nr:unnamed protein product [Darwinula stevensoni]CAG0885260.1 unnamed protein product [Darwinula stevensoni]